jgi:hypothetical protein
MSDAETTQEELDDFLRPAQPPRNPAYVAWCDAKIVCALEAAEARPEKRIPQRKIWKKFGLES